MNSWHMFVSGRVQGVGFRFFVQRAAAEAGVAGWVRNLPDGRVEILAQGDDDTLSRFEQEIRRGTFLARVDEIDKREEDHPQMHDFRITY